MEHDPLAADHPQLQVVLDALDDPECRTIIEQMEAPMTAKELSENCDVPLSTTYRKLDLLTMPHWSKSRPNSGPAVDTRHGTR